MFNLHIYPTSQMSTDSKREPKSWQGNENLPIQWQADILDLLSSAKQCSCPVCQHTWRILQNLTLVQRKTQSYCRWGRWLLRYTGNTRKYNITWGYHETIEYLASLKSVADVNNISAHWKKLWNLGFIVYRKHIIPAMSACPLYILQRTA